MSVRSRGDSPQQPELKPRQVRAIAALVEGSSPARVVRDLKIPARTLWKWRHEDRVFMAELRRQQGLVLAASQGRLQVATQNAVEVLDDMCTSHVSTGGEKVAAARAILEIAYKHIELAQINERMHEIEAALRAERSESEAGE